MTINMYAKLCDCRIWMLSKLCTIQLCADPIKINKKSVNFFLKNLFIKVIRVIRYKSDILNYWVHKK
jgi:hypothetical protein